MSQVLVRVVAPVIAMGATFLAKKGMTSLYKARTGHEPPQADDVEVSLVRAIGWATMTAAVCAVIEVTITRVAADREASRPDAEVPADVG